jgi:hypothetical protein
MAVPPQLMEQLLALDEGIRREIAEALFASVDTWDDDLTTPEEQAELDTIIAQSDAELAAGLGIPAEQAIAELRARREQRLRARR